MTTNDYDREFDDFFRRNDPRLRGYLAKIVGAPPNVVDDAAPFAFMVIRRHWKRLRAGAPRAYLFVVGHRRAVELLQTARYRLEAATDLLDQVGTDIAVTHNQIDGLIDRLLLGKLLEQLPPTLRQAVTLRHIEGFSITETAAIMNVKPGTVKRYTYEGLAQLHELITRETDTGEGENK